MEFYKLDDFVLWKFRDYPRRPRSTERSKRPKCGAKCRDGHACRAPVVWDKEYNRPRNGRCKLHGGKSTGPRTPEGKARIAEAQRERWQKWRIRSLASKA